MKILLTADLHGVRPWFDWIKVHAPEFDLVCIAGDMLDAFDPSGLTTQALALEEWCHDFPTPLALCSGNHDANGEGFWSQDVGHVSKLPDDHGERLHGMLGAERWMDCLARPGFVTDGSTELLPTPSGPVVVTTIPFADQGSASSKALWGRGMRLRLQHRVPWIVLHHQPPAGSLVGGCFGSPRLTWHLKFERPDFVASGHHHYQPYRGDFAERLGPTWCFNAGYPPDGQVDRPAVPNHIVVDTETATAMWDAASETGTTRIRRSVRFSR